MPCYEAKAPIADRLSWNCRWWGVLDKFQILQGLAPGSGQKHPSALQLSVRVIQTKSAQDTFAPHFWACAPRRPLASSPGPGFRRASLKLSPTQGTRSRAYPSPYPFLRLKRTIQG